MVVVLWYAADIVVDEQKCGSPVFSLPGIPKEGGSEQGTGAEEIEKGNNPERSTDAATATSDLKFKFKMKIRKCY